MMALRFLFLPQRKKIEVSTAVVRDTNWFSVSNDPVQPYAHYFACAGRFTWPGAKDEAP